MIDLERINACLDEIAREKEASRPEGFTVSEYAEQAGLKNSGAVKRLNALVRRGKLRVLKHPIKGSPTNIYQFVPEEDQNAEHEL